MRARSLLTALAVLSFATCRPDTDPNFARLEFGVSPDGTRLAYPVLAYDKLAEPCTEVWAANLDGSAPKRLGTLSGCYDVKWLGTGRVAAFELHTHRIPVFRVDGTPDSAITLPETFGWWMATPSPDGQWLAVSAFDSKAGSPGVYVIRAGNGDARKLNDDLVRCFVAWSPDSKRIAYGVGDYQKNYRLTIVDVASRKAVATGVDGTGACWSPDGKLIACTGQALQGGSWLCGVPNDGYVLKVDLATNKATPLTDPPKHVYDATTGDGESRGALCPVWSPDGTRIAYRRQQTVYSKDDVETSADELWVMNADGTGRQIVLKEWSPYAWAPDSRSLLVKEEKGISRVDLATRERRPVVTWNPAVPPSQEADWKTLKGDGVELSYRQIDPAYAKAILAVVGAARHVYKDELKCDMPDVVKVTLDKDPTRTVLFNDGDAGVILSLKSNSDLAPPAVSGYFQIYGFCHELGHLSMYRRVRILGLPSGVGEGWADFAGSYVTDKVFAKLGKSVWPQPYDYSADGMKRLRRHSSGAQSDPTGIAGKAFLAALDKYGAQKVFDAMNAASANRPLGKDLMPRFVAELVRLTGDSSALGLFPAEVTASKLAWHVKSRATGPEATQGQIAEPDATGTLLRYEDATSDGQRSITGAGHAVLFRCPEGQWAVDGVQLFGSRYGPVDPPTDTFSIFLCDANFDVVGEVQPPYAKLDPGPDKWQRFDFDAVPVPRAFYVCAYFHPTASKGFFMNFHRGSAANHSREALPWTFVSDTNGFDWMIRVHVRKVASK